MVEFDPYKYTTPELKQSFNHGRKTVQLFEEQYECLNATYFNKKNWRIDSDIYILKCDYYELMYIVLQMWILQLVEIVGGKVVYHLQTKKNFPISSNTYCLRINYFYWFYVSSKSPHWELKM